MKKSPSVIVSIVISLGTAFITTIITNSYNVIYTAGKYIEKIERLENMSTKQNDSLLEMKTKINTMVAVLQLDYPNINVNAFLENAANNHSSPSKIAKGLKELKMKDAASGTQYLLENYNFNKTQLNSVFTPNTDANSSALEKSD